MVVQIFQIANTQKRFKKKKHGMQQSIQRPCPAKAGHVVDAGTLAASRKKEKSK